MNYEKTKSNDHKRQHIYAQVPKSKQHKHSMIKHSVFCMVINYKHPTKHYNNCTKGKEIKFLKVKPYVLISYYNTCILYPTITTRSSKNNTI